jgi:hypothetical protein
MFDSFLRIFQMQLLGRFSTPWDREDGAEGLRFSRT